LVVGGRCEPGRHAPFGRCVAARHAKATDSPDHAALSRPSGVSGPRSEHSARRRHSNRRGALSAGRARLARWPPCAAARLVGRLASSMYERGPAPCTRAGRGHSRRTRTSRGRIRVFAAVAAGAPEAETLADRARGQVLTWLCWPFLEPVGSASAGRLHRNVRCRHLPVYSANDSVFGPSSLLPACRAASLCRPAQA